MVDTFTSGLRIRKQQTGANRNTWGGLINEAAFELFEAAIRGAASVTIAATDVTLTTQNGAADQARNMMLVLGGAPGTSRNVIVPGVSKVYIVVNNTGFAQTVKTASGSGVSVPDGARQLVMCDGTVVTALQASSLGTVANAELLDGLDSSAFAQLAAFNNFTRGFAVAFDTLADGGTVTLDASQGNKFFLAIGGNRSLIINNAEDGQEIEIWIKQDATGGRTLTWPAEVMFEAGSSSALSEESDALDRFDLTYNEALDLFIARSALNAGGGADVTVSIEGTHTNLNIYEALGEPSGATSVSVTIEAGARVYSLTPGAPALDLDGFDTGSDITLVNLGKIMGAGGRGGDGGGISRVGDSDYGWSGDAGGAGGTAVRGPGTGVTFEIDNADGFIWGGGGGGGGGGSSADDGNNIANGGSGGGGAGGGAPGTPSRIRYAEGQTATAANKGTHGTYLNTAANGTGGTGTETGTAEGGDGGAGGDWGTAGSSGQAPTGQATDIAAGAAGAAGLAVDQNGGTATFLSGSGSPNVKGAVT